MKSDYFKNEYPLEELIPDLEEDEEHFINDCDGLYWDDIPLEGLTDNEKNTIDVEVSNEAGVNFREGYEYAQAIINKKLKAIKIVSIEYETKNP